MPEYLFREYCEKWIVRYVNSICDKTDGVQITKDDVFVVWMCKTLQNNKALLSTKLPDGMYYEFTCDGDKGKIYVDVYKKWLNVAENYAI